MFDPTFHRTVWPNIYTQKALGVILIILVLLNGVFIKYQTPLVLLITLLGLTIFFFVMLNKYTFFWRNLDKSSFYRHLFIHSLFYRLICIGIVSWLTYIYQPESLPLEMYAADAWKYFASGSELTNNIFNGQFIFLLSKFWYSSADWGYPFFIGIVNTIFGNSVLITKIINAILGSFSVVLLAKIARLLYSYNHARFTGIIAMLMPSLVWYSAKYLKETLMIFIIILVFYAAIKMVRIGRFNLFELLLILCGTSSLFYFRTSLAVIVILALTVYFVLNSLSQNRGQTTAFIVGISFIIGIIVLSTYFGQVREVTHQYAQLDEAAKIRITTKLDLAGGVNLKSSVAIPLVMINTLVAPYPSFLNIDSRQISVISHSQNEITRIFIYYFGFLGFFLLLKSDYKKSSLILSFSLGYLLMMALTGAAMFARFQLPAVPFIIIMISVGFIDSPQKWFTRWSGYIVVMGIAIIMWHLFKLYIRGMI